MKKIIVKNVINYLKKMLKLKTLVYENLKFFPPLSLKNPQEYAGKFEKKTSSKSTKKFAGKKLKKKRLPVRANFK
jgi:hypothetical protein